MEVGSLVSAASNIHNYGDQQEISFVSVNYDETQIAQPTVWWILSTRRPGLWLISVSEVTCEWMCFKSNKITHAWLFYEGNFTIVNFIGLILIISGRSAQPRWIKCDYKRIEIHIFPSYFFRIPVTCASAFLRRLPLHQTSLWLPVVVCWFRRVANMSAFSVLSRKRRCPSSAEARSCGWRPISTCWLTLSGMATLSVTTELATVICSSRCVSFDNGRDYESPPGCPVGAT